MTPYYMRSIIYYGGFLDRLAALTEHGIDIPENPVKDIHMTLEYFGSRNRDLSNIPIDDLGFEFFVKVDGIGQYYNDGILQNIALRVDEKSLKENKIPDGRTVFDLFKGETPHITLAVRNGGKAVNSSNCVFEDIEPFVLPLTLDVFGQGKKRYMGSEMHLADDDWWSEGFWGL